MIYVGTVHLELQHEIKTKPPHDCPGDIMAYNCSIFSNIEELKLTWIVTLPQNKSANSVTLSGSTLTGFNLGNFAKATLTEFDATNGYIESSLELYLLNGASMNTTIIECHIDDLDSKKIEVILDTPGTLYNYN